MVKEFGQIRERESSGDIWCALNAHGNLCFEGMKALQGIILIFREKLKFREKFSFKKLAFLYTFYCYIN